MYIINKIKILIKKYMLLFIINHLSFKKNYLKILFKNLLIRIFLFILYLLKYLWKMIKKHGGRLPIIIFWFYILNVDSILGNLSIFHLFLSLWWLLIFKFKKLKKSWTLWQLWQPWTFISLNLQVFINYVQTKIFLK